MPATPRKYTRKVLHDRRGFVRTTERWPFDASRGERFDAVNITYRPHGFSADMVTVRAEPDGSRVSVQWTSGHRDMEQEPDNALAVRAFARAFRDAMLQWERLRRHMGFESNPMQRKEWQ